MAVTTWEQGTPRAPAALATETSARAATPGAEPAREPASHRRAEYVYEWPVRIWHWTITGGILLLTATGLLITYPVASFGTGWPRLLHFAAGDVLAVAMLARAYWAIVGNRHAREIFTLPIQIFRRRFWLGIVEDLRWYLFLRDRAPVELGHNPLAVVAMFGMFLLGTVFMIATGFALYAEDTPGGRMWKAFGWVFLIGNDASIRTYHHLGMWLILTFAIVHTYMVIRAEVMNGATSIESMIGGWKRLKDE